MKKLIPLIIAVVGLGGGLAAGTMLKPAEPMMDIEHAEGMDDHGKAEMSAKGKDKDAKGGDTSEYIYVGLEKPFFAPVMKNNHRSGLVRLDIHLEIPADLKDQVEQHEPKLRDGFLRAVMNFSHEGGFSRVHGADGFMVLSDDLLLSARSVLGNDVKAVLIGEILTRES